MLHQNDMPTEQITAVACLKWACIACNLKVSVGWMQNPDAVALKEDMRRSRTRLKLAQQNKKQAEQEQEQQHSRVAKLEQDLERVSAGNRVDPAAAS